MASFDRAAAPTKQNVYFLPACPIEMCSSNNCRGITQKLRKGINANREIETLSRSTNLKSFSFFGDELAVSLLLCLCVCVPRTPQGAQPHCDDIDLITSPRIEFMDSPMRAFRPACFGRLRVAYAPLSRPRHFPSRATSKTSSTTARAATGTGLLYQSGHRGRPGSAEVVAFIAELRQGTGHGSVRLPVSPVPRYHLRSRDHRISQQFTYSRNRLWFPRLMVSTRNGFHGLAVHPLWFPKLAKWKPSFFFVYLRASMPEMGPSLTIRISPPPPCVC